LQKKLKKIKSIIILLILLINVVIIFTPYTQAALFKSDAHLSLELNADDIHERIMPLSKPTRIRINVGYQVIGKFVKKTSAHFKNKGTPATIHLSVEEIPNGCTATIEPSTVNIEVGANWNYASAALLVRFDENVPGLKPVKIKVKMHADELSSSIYKINEIIDYDEITVMPDFLLVFDVIPKNTFKEISPGETAFFDIELKNLGNAKTTFRFKTLKEPEGLNVKIISDVVLESKLSGGDSTETIQLAVYPQNDLSFYNNEEVIQISVIATQYGAPSEDGQEIILSFTVKTSGSSILIVGTISTFVVFIAVILLYYYRYRYRKQRKD